MPAGLRGWARQAAGVKADWCQLLAGRCDTACTPKQAPATTPGSALGPLRPVLAVPTGQIAVVLDTSGSMGQEDHAQAFSEIDAVLAKAVPGVAVTVLSVDDDIDSIRRVTHTRQIAPLGGGGTDMAAGIETVAQACPAAIVVITDMAAGIETVAQACPAAIVVITDGYTRWPPSPPPGARCVIAALTRTGWMH